MFPLIPNQYINKSIFFRLRSCRRAALLQLCISLHINKERRKEVEEKEDNAERSGGRVALCSASFCSASLCPSSLQQQLHTFSHDEKFPQRQQRPRSRKELTGAGRRLSAAGGSSTSLLSAPAHCRNLSDPPTTPITPTTHTLTYTHTAVVVNLVT